MKRKLVLIKGGKVARGGGGGGGPPPTAAARRGRRRPNPLNQLLWYATSRAYYAQRATSVEMISERMTRLSNRVLGRHINVAVSTASDVIDDCRRRKFAYGWMLLHAQKGSVGYLRGYVTALADLTDQDEEMFLIDESDLNFAISGLRSSLRTIESMIINDADGVNFTIAALAATGSETAADRLRSVIDQLRTAATSVTAVRQEIDAL